MPETANILLSGGVKFETMSEDAQEKFQENLLKTMMQIEQSFFDLAESSRKNCLIICDRGAMDASAFLTRNQWMTILERIDVEEDEIRDDRYDQG